MSPKVGPTDKGSEYGAKIGAMFIYFQKKRIKNLKIFYYSSQHDIARMENPNHLQGVAKNKITLNNKLILATQSTFRMEKMGKKRNMWI